MNNWNGRKRKEKSEKEKSEKEKYIQITFVSPYQLGSIKISNNGYVGEFWCDANGSLHYPYDKSSISKTFGTTKLSSFGFLDTIS